MVVLNHRLPSSVSSEYNSHSWARGWVPTLHVCDSILWYESHLTGTSQWNTQMYTQHARERYPACSVHAGYIVASWQQLKTAPYTPRQEAFGGWDYVQLEKMSSSFCGLGILNGIWISLYPDSKHPSQIEWSPSRRTFVSDCFSCIAPRCLYIDINVTIFWMFNIDERLCRRNSNQPQWRCGSSCVFLSQR